MGADQPELAVPATDRKGGRGCSTAVCEKTARTVVWEGAGAQSPAPDPIADDIGMHRSGHDCKKTRWHCGYRVLETAPAFERAG